MTLAFKSAFMISYALRETWKKDAWAMKRALSFVGLISVGLVVAGCDYNRPTSIAQGPTEQTFYTQNGIEMAGGSYSLNHLKKIVLTGSAVATIKSDQPENVLRVNGNPAVLKDTTVVQKDGVLYVSSVAPKHSNQVEIDLQSYKAPLNIEASGNSHTKMEGNFLIQKIDVSSSARLKLYWLNTSHLTVNTSGNAKVFLAGVATHLDVTASGSSVVNGKYLRVDESYVLAQGNAQVGVSVKKALGTQSIGSASVYYYRYPEYAGIYLNGSASALNMKGISGPSNHLLD
jgi:hypothetical protein